MTIPTFGPTTRYFNGFRWKCIKDYERSEDGDILDCNSRLFHMETGATTKYQMTTPSGMLITGNTGHLFAIRKILSRFTGRTARNQPADGEKTGNQQCLSLLRKTRSEKTDTTHALQPDRSLSSS